jgi:hypothetical protein
MLHRNTRNRANCKDAENPGIREILSIGFVIPGALP